LGGLRLNLITDYLEFLDSLWRFVARNWFFLIVTYIIYSVVFSSPLKKLRKSLSRQWHSRPTKRFEFDEETQSYSEAIESERKPRDLHPWHLWKRLLRIKD
jgi:hypothetical protein